MQGQGIERAPVPRQLLYLNVIAELSEVEPPLARDIGGYLRVKALEWTSLPGTRLVLRRMEARGLVARAGVPPRFSLTEEGRRWL